jgi:hypothetical protein
MDTNQAQFFETCVYLAEGFLPDKFYQDRLHVVRLLESGDMGLAMLFLMAHLDLTQEPPLRSQVKQLRFHQGGPGQDWIALQFPIPPEAPERVPRFVLMAGSRYFLMRYSELFLRLESGELLLQARMDAKLENLLAFLGLFSSGHSGS